MCEDYLPEMAIGFVQDFECQDRVRLFEEATYGTPEYATDRGFHSFRHALLKDNLTDVYKGLRPDPDFIAIPLYHATRLSLISIVTSLLNETNSSDLSLHQPIY